MCCCCFFMFFVVYVITCSLSRSFLFFVISAAFLSSNVPTIACLPSVFCRVKFAFHFEISLLQLFSLIMFSNVSLLLHRFLFILALVRSSHYFMFIPIHLVQSSFLPRIFFSRSLHHFIWTHQLYFMLFFSSYISAIFSRCFRFRWKKIVIIVRSKSFGES